MIGKKHDSEACWLLNSGASTQLPQPPHQKTRRPPIYGRAVVIVFAVDRPESLSVMRRNSGIILKVSSLPPPRAYHLSSIRCATAQVFDRDLKLRQRQYALHLPDGDDYDYLRNESAANLIDRLDDITRQFPRALELGSYRGSILSTLQEKPNFNGEGAVGGIKSLVQCDMMPPPAVASKENRRNVLGAEDVRTVVTGSEESLPFEQHSFDLVLSSLTMHWVNDLPRYLLQIRDVLRPDGAFLGSMLGGNTLKELRYCFYLAEQERTGGLSAHVSPLIKTSDVAALMQAAGFSLPTVDIDTITISYPDAFSLMEHLVHMGEGNAAFARQYPVGRDTFLAMASTYQELFGLEDGSVSATYEIIYVIGWSPSDDQPTACRRGSATASIKDIKNL